MPCGALFVKFFYPGHFGLTIPSNYFLEVEGKPALVRLLNQIKPVEVLDFTNELIADPKGGNFRKLMNPIESPSSQSLEFFGRTLETEQPDRTSHGLKEGKIADLPHRLTLDAISFDKYKLYKTRDWTDIVIIYEVEDIQNVTAVEATFFQKALNRFNQVYRLMTKDSRVRYFDDVGEAIHWNIAKVEFSQEEMTGSPQDRLAAARESVKFENKSISFPYAHEGFFEFDTKAITQKVFDLLKANRWLSVAEELLLNAHEAAYYRKNFRYALVEAFTAAEVCVSNFLSKSKLGRGVSQGKLKEYKDEVSISYKLNVEMPVFLENLRLDERQAIGRVDGLRKQRNEVVHGAKFVSEAEAKEAVETTGALFNMLIARGIEV